MSVRAWAAHIKKQAWVWDDTYSIGQISHLSALLRRIVPLPRHSARLHGYNFIFNNQTNECLGADGYDNYQAPMDGARALFSRRMWVGGALDHLRPLQPNDVVRCTERVRAVRQVGASVFVTVGRDMARAGEQVMHETRTLVYTNERYLAPGGAGNVTGLRAVSATKDTQSLEKRHAADTEPAFSARDSSLSTGLLFCLSDVMRFCALSYNLHKIHYDRRYCASENLPNVVVPGPLLASVMLHYASSLLPDVNFGRFTYRNSLPCYIDEPVELVLRPREGGYEVHVMRGLRQLAGGAIGVTAPKVPAAVQ